MSLPLKSLRWLWEQRDRIRSPSQDSGILAEGVKSFQIAVGLESCLVKTQHLNCFILCCVSYRKPGKKYKGKIKIK